MGGAFDVGVSATTRELGGVWNRRRADLSNSRAPPPSDPPLAAVACHGVSVSPSPTGNLYAAGMSVLVSGHPRRFASLRIAADFRQRASRVRLGAAVSIGGEAPRAGGLRGVAAHRVGVAVRDPPHAVDILLARGDARDATRTRVRRFERRSARSPSLSPSLSPSPSPSPRASPTSFSSAAAAG